jgi:hypothetical protein
MYLRQSSRLLVQAMAFDGPPADAATGPSIQTRRNSRRELAVRDWVVSLRQNSLPCTQDALMRRLGQPVHKGNSVWKSNRKNRFGVVKEEPLANYALR